MVLISKLLNISAISNNFFTARISIRCQEIRELFQFKNNVIALMFMYKCLLHKYCIRHRICNIDPYKLYEGICFYNKYFYA
jgi:hypothetical protein